MLEWLAQQGFDPLHQSADYFRLTGTGTPAVNPVHIEVSGASRYYLYTPVSAENFKPDQPLEEQDARFATRGLTGARRYTMDEYSSSKPAELTVRANWVSSPETEEQRRYLEAEVVYRDFVYANYTAVDAELEPLLQARFWQDYAPESDGIYSALTHVREVLRTTAAYAAAPDLSAEEMQPIRAFLTGEAEGNAVAYASAAVQALRSHGIPTRYVEGYYVSAAAAATGSAVLTGQNAHAWIEIFFDGIGWLPVDVTPGYYYDTLTLRQMVALPDTPRKAAALGDSGESSDTLTTDAPAGASAHRPGHRAAASGTSGHRVFAGGRGRAAGRASAVRGGSAGKGALPPRRRTAGKGRIRRGGSGAL